MIWLARRAIFKENTLLSMVKFFKRPIAHSTWMRKDAMDLPCCTSLADSCCLPSRKGGIFNATSMLCRIVNPPSAITDMFFLPCSLSNNPEERVSSGSDIEPTNAGDTKVIAPFDVMPIRTLETQTLLMVHTVNKCA